MGIYICTNLSSTSDHHAINEYQLRLDVQRFLWPVYYIIYLFTRVLYFASWGVITWILYCAFWGVISQHIYSALLRSHTEGSFYFLPTSHIKRLEGST